MSHKHLNENGESYSMPTQKCVKCGGECCTDCSFKGCCDYCIPDVDLADLSQPPPGSWADVAREMARMFPDDGIDWDAWKDQMKEQDF